MQTSWTMTRYLAYNLWQWFLIISTAFGSIIAVFDAIDLLRRAGGKADITGLLVFKMLLCRFPMHFQEILPFVMFFAAILCLWRLNRFYEIIAMRALGLSVWQILSPMVILAVTIGLIDLFIFSPFSSKLMDRFDYLENLYLHEQKNAYEISSTGIWLKEKIGDQYRIIHAGHMDEEKGQLHPLTIYIFDQKQVFLSRMDAHFAQLREGQLILHNVWQADTLSSPQMSQKLVIQTQMSFTNIHQSFADPRTIPFWSLPEYASMMNQAGMSSQRYDLQFYTLIAKSIWLGIMVVLAACFGIGTVRQAHPWRVIILGILVAFLIYFFKDVTAAMGQAGTIPPFLAAFASCCIAALFAITRLLYVEEG